MKFKSVTTQMKALDESLFNGDVLVAEQSSCFFQFYVSFEQRNTAFQILDMI